MKVGESLTVTRAYCFGGGVQGLGSNSCVWGERHKEEEEEPAFAESCTGPDTGMDALCYYSHFIHSLLVPNLFSCHPLPCSIHFNGFQSLFAQRPNSWSLALRPGMVWLLLMESACFFFISLFLVLQSYLTFFPLAIIVWFPYISWSLAHFWHRIGAR